MRDNKCHNMPRCSKACRNRMNMRSGSALSIPYPCGTDRRLLAISFAAYLTVLLWIVIFKCNIETPIFENFVKMRPLTIAERLEFGFRGRMISRWLFNRDMLLNVVVFVPLGAYLPLLGRRSVSAVYPLIAAGLSLGFEISQLLSCVGAFDYQDVIANTLGFILGYLCFAPIFRLLEDRASGFVNRVNLAASIVGVPVAVYVVMNTLLHVEIYTSAYYGL